MPQGVIVHQPTDQKQHEIEAEVAANIPEDYSEEEEVLGKVHQYEERFFTEQQQQQQGAEKGSDVWLDAAVEQAKKKQARSRSFFYLCPSLSLSFFL